MIRGAFWVNALGWTLVVLSGIALIVAVAGPSLGLGSGEDYWLWRHADISRSNLATRALIGGALGTFILTICLVANSRIPALLVPIQNYCVSRGFDFLGTGWSRANGNWISTFLLLPMALYLFVILTVIMPGTPWVDGDTGTYLGLSQVRSLFYSVGIRLLAILSEDPWPLYIPPLLAGLAATLFFVESIQRLTRNIFFSVPTGVVIFACWGLWELGGFLLTDFWFYSLFTTCLALVMVILNRPSSGMFFTLAIFSALTLWVRPTGIIVLIIVMLLLIFRLHLWKKITLFFILPLSVFCLLISLSHLYIFGYFGLSKFSGWGTSAPTMMLLRADTQAKYPTVRNALLEFAKPFQDEYAAAPNPDEKLKVLFQVTNPLMNKSLDVIYDFGRTGAAELSSLKNQKWLADKMSGWSKQNKAISEQYGTQSNPFWIWANDTLFKLGVSAHINNIPTFLDMTFVKIRYSWKNMFFFFDATNSPRTSFSVYGEGPEEGQPVTKELQSFLGLDTSLYNRIATRLRILNEQLNFPAIVTMSGAVVLLLAAWAAFRRKTIPSTIVGLIFLVAVTILNIVIISVAQIPVTRFLVVIQAAPAALLFSPVLLIQPAFRFFAHHSKSSAC